MNDADRYRLLKVKIRMIHDINAGFAVNPPTHSPDAGAWAERASVLDPIIEEIERLDSTPWTPSLPERGDL